MSPKTNFPTKKIWRHDIQPEIDPVIMALDTLFEVVSFDRQRKIWDTLISQWNYLCNKQAEYIAKHDLKCQVCGAQSKTFEDLLFWEGIAYCGGCYDKKRLQYDLEQVESEITYNQHERDNLMERAEDIKTRLRAMGS
jgi:carboxypeptidase C (cathepsin A)